MTTVMMNTMNENPQWLIQAIESQLSNKVEKQIIISTMLRDKNNDILTHYKNRGDIEIHYCDHTKHPGKSPLGAYYQINSALHLVRGEWFFYISSNDYASAYKMADEIRACERAKKLVCYSSFNTVSELGTFMKKREFRSAYSYPAHIRGNYISDASLVHTSLLKKYAPFRSDLYDNFAHWDFWLRIYEGEGDVFTYNPLTAFYYRQNGDSMHNKRKADPTTQVRVREMTDKLLKYNNRFLIKQ